MDAAELWSWIAVAGFVLATVMFAMWIREQTRVYKRDLVLKGLVNGDFISLEDASESAEWALSDE